MRQLLRVTTMIVALIASGLALVAVAPAPPAAAAFTTFAQVGPESTPNSSICRNGDSQTPSSWFRRFSLDSVAEGEVFNATSITFGVQSITLPAGMSSLKVRARIYRFPADGRHLFSWDDLSRAEFVGATATLTSSDGPLKSVTVTSDFGSYDRSDDMVVEIFYAGSVPGERFVIGSNGGQEQQWGLFSYPTCSQTGDSIQETWTRFPNMGVVISVSGELGLDLDQDTIPNNLDMCPNRAGPRDGAYAGCPRFTQVVSAGFDWKKNVVSGTVSIDVPGGTDGVSCLDRVPVQIVNATTGEPYGSPMTIRGVLRTDKIFSLDASNIPEGTRVGVRVDGYFDRNLQNEGLAVCEASASAFTTVEGKVDADKDGIPNDADSCPDAFGPSADDHNGCPRVQRNLSASYQDGVITGAMSASDGACMGQSRVLVYWLQPTGPSLVGSADTASDGAFQVNLGRAFDDKTQLKAEVSGLYQVGKVVCLGSTVAIDVVKDGDGDGVRDRDDACVARPSDGTYGNGCPGVARVFSVPTYAKGVLSGTLTVADKSKVPPGSCLAANSIRLLTGTWPNLRLITGEVPAGSESFSIPVVMRAGDIYTLTAQEYVDPGAGWCGAAATGLRTMDVADGDGDGVVDTDDECLTLKGDGTSADGCPTVEREFSVDYANGVVFGNLAIKSSEAGGCTAENRIAVTPDRTGMPVYGQADATTGRFVIPVSMADGDGYVLTADRYLDAAAGWCDAGRTEAIVEIDLDNDGVNDDEDACDDVAGDGTSDDGCPLVERELIDVSYARGVVSGRLTLEDSESGGCGFADQVAVTPAETGVPVYGVAAKTTGAFEIAVEMADEDVYVVSAETYLDRAAGWCSRATTEATVEIDLDNDDVVDDLDQCPALEGVPDLDPAFSGCPTLERTVTARYEGGTITGQRESRELGWVRAGADGLGVPGAVDG